MKKIFLGSTAIEVSRLGLGTVKFGRNQGVKYPREFVLPTDAEIQTLLATAKNLGINLLDTAPAYGTSEERLGKALQGQRQDWIISTKVGEDFSQGESIFDFSEAAIHKSIERSLQRLKTDYIDIVLLHSNGEDEKIIAEGALQVLADIKQAGKIRSFGMSTKTIRGGKLAVEQSDVVMVTYNPLQPEEKIVIDYAGQNGKGVFIKKAFASGHLEKISGEDPVRAAMQFIFAVPGVTSIILGTLNANHLMHNVLCAEEML